MEIGYGRIADIERILKKKKWNFLYIIICEKVVVMRVLLEEAA